MTWQQWQIATHAAAYNHGQAIHWQESQQQRLASHRARSPLASNSTSDSSDDPGNEARLTDSKIVPNSSSSLQSQTSLSHLQQMEALRKRLLASSFFKKVKAETARSASDARFRARLSRHIAYGTPTATQLPTSQLERRAIDGHATLDRTKWCGRPSPPRKSRRNRQQRFIQLQQALESFASHVLRSAARRERADGRQHQVPVE